MKSIGKKSIINQLILFIGSVTAVSGLLSNTGFETSLYADPGLADSGILTVGWTYFQRVFDYDKITALVLAICFMYFYQKLIINNRPGHRDCVMAGVMALVFSAVQTIGNSFYKSVMNIREKNYTAPVYMSYMLLNILVYFIIPSSGSGRYGWPVMVLVPMMAVSLFLSVSSEDPPKEIQIREENSRKAEAYEG